jgi:multiple sugar transport system permease protein
MDQGSAPMQDIGVEPSAQLRSQPITAVRKGSLGFKLRDYAGSFAFLIPYLAFAILFLYAPLIYAFILSLHQWSTIAGDQGFVGLLHYHTLFLKSSSIYFQNFWAGIEHTALFVVITVPLLVAISLGLALLLANAPFRAFFRAIFYIPAVLSVTVACTIWLWIFQNPGLLTSMFHVNVDWTTTQPWAWVTIIVTTLWWTIGFNMVILLAGIIEVPNDYHEAAKIDGARAWQRVLHITIPLIRPILAFVTITQMIASFGLFGQSYVITRGGPSQSTQPITMYILNEAFGDFNLAMASAMSFVLGIILIVLAILQFRLFRAGEA